MSSSVIATLLTPALARSSSAPLRTTGTASAQVGLRADAVDGDALGDPLLDFVGETLGLRIAGRVEVIVIDVQLRVWVGLSGGLEGDADEVLAEDIGEDAGAEAAVLWKSGQYG